MMRLRRSITSRLGTIMNIKQPDSIEGLDFSGASEAVAAGLPDPALLSRLASQFYQEFLQQAPPVPGTPPIPATADETSFTTLSSPTSTPLPISPPVPLNEPARGQFRRPVPATPDLSEAEF